jgi:hypothetical protein
VAEDLNEVARETNDFAMVAEANQEKMETEITKVRAMIGDPVMVDNLSFPMVWSAIRYLADKTAESAQMDPTSSTAICKAVSDVDTISASLNSFGAFGKMMMARIKELKDFVEALDNWTKSLPMAPTRPVGSSLTCY